jgi:hypothetical protein
VVTVTSSSLESETRLDFWETEELALDEIWLDVLVLVSKLEALVVVLSSVSHFPRSKDKICVTYVVAGLELDEEGFEELYRKMSAAAMRIRVYEPIRSIRMSDSKF